MPWKLAALCGPTKHFDYVDRQCEKDEYDEQSHAQWWADFYREVYDVTCDVYFRNAADDEEDEDGSW